MAPLPAKNDPCPCKSGKKYKKCCEGKSSLAKFISFASPRKRQTFYWLFLLVFLSCAGWATYSNSLSGDFMLDDYPHIVDNENIRASSSLMNILTDTRRPVVKLSLALNYRLHGLDKEGYHVFNLIVHCLNGIVLFLLLTRILEICLPAKPAAQRLTTACAASLLWLAHPLNTQSVTYIIQRSESLMGLFYLLTFLSAVMSFQTGKRRTFWALVSTSFCFLGTLTKESMVTAPALILLFDRTFVSGSFAVAWRRNRSLYCGLFLSWAVMALLLFLTKTEELRPTAGFTSTEVSWFRYLMTQPNVILHYLRLAFYPRPLVFDYAWPFAENIREVLLPLTAVSAMIAAASILVWKRSKAGFAAAAFFLLLAPTSSILPIKDALFEYRMYLPLIALAILFVCGLQSLLEEIFSKDIVRLKLFLIIIILIAVSLGHATFERNKDYHHRVLMWKDVIRKQPANARAHNNLGKIYFDMGEGKKALSFYQKAVRLDPDYSDAYTNIGVYYSKAGNPAKAEGFYRRALGLDEKHGVAHYNLGTLLMAEQKYQEAVGHFLQALKYRFFKPDVYHNLALCLYGIDKRGEALSVLKILTQRHPGYRPGHKLLDEMRRMPPATP